LESPLLWPNATQLSEKWRHDTIRSLRAICQLNNGSAQCGNAIRASYDANLQRVQKDIKTLIQTVSPDFQADQDISTNIVTAAAKLALACAVQQCRIQPSRFPIGLKVDHTFKDDLNDRNRANASGTISGVVRFFICPGLQRIGDAKGGSLDQPLVTIHPADVYLVAES
jgi:hypothetical protein